MRNSNKELEIILDYNFKNPDLLKQSLIHKSFDNINNNEKLEFLGDRVLGLIISKKLDIKKFMFLGASNKSLQRSADKIIGDCLESLIGAIYLDSGLKSAEKFVLNFWKQYLENSILPLIDAKTQLQEYSLKKFKKLPKYTFYKKTGPQHRPIFKTDVQIPNSKKAIGIGTSKKNAQQNAASKLLRSLKIL